MRIKSRTTSVVMKTFYRRSLPHFQPGNGIYFITYRLANSLPLEIIPNLKEKFERYKQLLVKSDLPREEIEKQIDIRFRTNFAAYDRYLDSCVSGEPWISDERIAKYNYEEILKLNSENEKVICFSLMPNHVHLLLELRNISKNSNLIQELQNKPNSKTREYVLTDILRKLKGRTARGCNLILNRTGPFWQHESFDHLVRDANELERIILYILENPVKAGLCKEWAEWKWTYLHPDYML